MHVEAFLSTYENIIVRAKIEEDKAARLFVFLHEEARDYHRSSFIVGWALTEQGRDYAYVCNWLIARYCITACLEELVCIEMNVRFNKESLVKRHITLDQMYNKDGLNDRAKYRMFQKAVRKVVGYQNFWFLRVQTVIMG